MATQYTGTGQVDDSVIALMDQMFLISGGNGDNIVIDQVSTIERDINAKSITIPKYNRMAKVTTPLTETTDPDGVQITDTGVTVTPAEYGNVVTKTKLASLQTGGKIDLAAAKLVGINTAESVNAIGIKVGEAGTNIRLANGAASEGAITANDTIQESDIEYVVNRLRRNNAPPFQDGLYRSIVHVDVLDDVAKLAGWKDYQKYDDAADVVKEWQPRVFKGVLWLPTTGVTINADAGNGTVDTYHTQFFGMGAFGKAVSFDATQMITGPFDKLQRFVHVGWYGVFKYTIVDQNHHWIITSASSFGSNS